MSHLLLWEANGVRHLSDTSPVKAPQSPTWTCCCRALAVCQTLFISCFCLLTCTWNVRLSARRWAKLCQALAFKIGVILELAGCMVWDTMFFLKFQDLQCTEGENICSKFGTNSPGSKTWSEGRALESESVSLVRLFMVPCRKDNVFDERVQSHRLVWCLVKLLVCAPLSF